MCYYSLYDLGDFLHTVFFFSTQVIKYVSLSDFQGLFYRKVLFVEMNFTVSLQEFYYVRKDSLKK